MFREKPIEIYSSYLEDLKLTERLFKNRLILDIGVHDSAFAFVVMGKRILGAKVIGIDEYTYSYNNPLFVRAEAGFLPFKSNCFDIVLSHASIPGYARDIAEKTERRAVMERWFKEAIRVVKKQKRIYLGPIDEEETFINYEKKWPEIDYKPDWFFGEVMNILKELEAKSVCRINYRNPCFIIQKI